MGWAADFAKTAKNLIEIHNYASALDLVNRGIGRVQRFSDWQELFSVFEAMPQKFLSTHTDWALSYGKVLVGIRDAELLLEFAKQFLGQHRLPESADFLIDYAWALMVNGRYSEAKFFLEQAIAFVERGRLGVAWRRLALVYFDLDGDWQKAFALARSLLSGRQLGLCLLDEGGCWQRSADGAKARAVWQEAKALFSQDPFHLAWLEYNIGDSYMRDLRPEAETCLLEAERLTRRSTAKALRSRALQGLGTFYRTHGEWPRAEAAYQEAIKSALENDDAYVGHWSLGRCYRLMGKPGLAQKAIEQALAVSKGHPPIYVEQAAIYLAQGEPLAAARSLEQSPNPHGNHLYLARILQAEIARCSHNGSLALEWLRQVPTQVLVAREEARCWPELFKLGQSHGLEVARPLEYPQQITVQIRALGPLEVRVNSRTINLNPVSRVGELLVLLLENQGKASNGFLITHLWPNNLAKQKYPALWQLVHELRALLGWPDSIRASYRSFQLDPGVQWDYDVEKARKSGTQKWNFLEGISNPWVQEVARKLDQS